MATSNGNGEGTTAARVQLTAEPTQSPNAAPTATPVPPPTPAPVVEAPPPPPPEPTPRTCAAIRATGTYATDAERAFFLANCQTTPAASGAPAPTQPAAPPPPPPPSGQTEAERQYITRATNAIVYFQARFAQYWGQPSLGALADLVELSSVVRGFANEMNAIRPVPPQYQTVHTNVIQTAVAFSDILLLAQNISTQSQFVAWNAEVERRLDRFDQALTAFMAATGIELPSLRPL